MALLIFFYIISLCSAYKPVVLLHGIMTGNDSMSTIKSRIENTHPGTIVYNSDRFGGWSSLENMWYQVEQFGEDIVNISKQHPEGIHVVGYSQGALTARVILQSFDDLNVYKFVSLSGPQAGQYGTNFLHIIFPGLALKTAYELFYSKIGQHTSVGNYWNDPYHQDLYYDYSQFLPYVNNAIFSNRSIEFKQSLTKLEKMVLIGGPDDNVITPWQSSQFGYYDGNDTVIPMKDRKIYTKDKIGLKTLDLQGQLDVITVSGIDHFSWHKNVTFIDKYILPYLD